MRSVKQKKVGKRVGIYGGKYWEMFGIRLFGGRETQVLRMVEEWLNGSLGIKWIATVNPEFVMSAIKNAEFKAILSETTINVVDGIGLIWAKEVRSGRSPLQVGIEVLQGRHRDELVPGADLMDKMCGLAEKLGKTVYFYGGWDDRSKRTADYFIGKYPKLKVVGYRAEDYDWKTEADILFVARAMKKQEEWIADNKKRLKVKIVMGVGRSFDYYSGELKRAPGWLRKMGLEWLYSLYKEPKRWKRQLALPQFIWKVLKDRN